MRKVIIAVLFIAVVFILEVRARQTPEPTLTPSALETTSTPMVLPSLLTPEPKKLPSPVLEPAPALPILSPIAVPAPNEVWLQGGEYRPGSITVPVGTVVIWTNIDNDAHDVCSDTGLFFSSLARGDSLNYTFNERGIFDYHCGCNPGMEGKIIVE